jgi:glycosyltransferase involved in cell wall biosynthesis
VLLLTFSEQFTDLCRCVNMESLLEQYALVLEPSFSGYADSDILQFTVYRTHPIIVMATEDRDTEFLNRLNTNLIPVPFGASDWVDPELFYPLSGEAKAYDAFMIANWLPLKRHHVLFRAIAELGDPSYKLALAGNAWKSARADLEHLIDFYGLRSQIQVFDSLPAAEVNRVLNRAKLNVLMTRREGSNRSLFEGFLANVPGLALRNVIGPRKEYFTPQTGRLVDEKELPRALEWFRDHWTEFSPREWALANIAPAVTTRKLNELLKAHAAQRGESWSTDIVVKVNRPEVTYFERQSAEILPAMADIISTFDKGQTLTRAGQALSPVL